MWSIFCAHKPYFLMPGHINVLQILYNKCFVQVLVNMLHKLMELNIIHSVEVFVFNVCVTFLQLLLW